MLGKGVGKMKKSRFASGIASSFPNRILKDPLATFLNPSPLIETRGFLFSGEPFIG